MIGAPFMIMSIVDGFTPGVAIPDSITTDPKPSSSWAMAYVDGIVELCPRWTGWPAAWKVWASRTDSSSARWPLAGPARRLPGPGAARGGLSCASGWRPTGPTMSPAAIMHGDYSPFNVMVANDLPGAPGRHRRLGHRHHRRSPARPGPPVGPLGGARARWPVTRHRPTGGSRVTRPGPQMARRYGEADRPGSDRSGLLRGALVVQARRHPGGQLRPARRAGVPDPDNRMFTSAPRLFEVAAEFARGTRR